MIRQQVRRFIAEQVTPNGPVWEEQGSVPREVIRSLGDLGLLHLYDKIRTLPELGRAGYIRAAKLLRVGVLQPAGEPGSALDENFMPGFD